MTTAECQSGRVERAPARVEARSRGLNAVVSLASDASSYVMGSNVVVESALTQIYRKLDVRSRTELARKLASRV